MILDFKNEAELRKFADAQNKTIIELTKKLAQAEADKKHLQELLNGVVPATGMDLVVDTAVRINEEELICRQQLSMLRRISDNQQLTLEEARKVEIYTKLLAQLTRSNPQDINTSAKNLTDSELIKKLQNDSQ